MMRPELVVSDNPHVRVCAVLWRAHDLILSGKRRRIAAAVADAGFALCGPSSPELWRPGCDSAFSLALQQWQHTTFGYGVPPLLAVFDEAKTPEERAELVALAGRIVGALAQADAAGCAMTERVLAGATVSECSDMMGAALRDIARAFDLPAIEKAFDVPPAVLGAFKVEEVIGSEPVSRGRCAADVLTIVDEVRGVGKLATVTSFEWPADPDPDPDAVCLSVEQALACICTVPRRPDHRCPVHESAPDAPPLHDAIRERRVATDRRIVAVSVSLTSPMPPWVLARILDAAPSDAELAGLDQRWSSAELIVALRSWTFPTVPEGVEAPRVIAKVFDSTKQVQVEWPHRGMHDEDDVARAEAEHGLGSIPAMLARSAARAKKPKSCLWCASAPGERHDPGCPYYFC